MDIDFDGTSVYVSTYSSTAPWSALSIIDRSTQVVTDSIEVPWGFEIVSISQGRAYMIGGLIGNGRNNYVLVIDIATRNAIKMLKLPNYAYALEAISDDVFVMMDNGQSNPPRGQLFIIDAKTDTLRM